MPLSSLLGLAALVFVAVTFVVIGDTAGKLLTSGGVAPAVVAWSRFVIGALLVLPFSGLSLREFAYLRDWRVALRGALVSGGIFCILTALKTEPIANVFGAFFIAPIISYLLAILFLGETPSRSRTGLLVVGFVGVMCVVKPGFGASWGIMFALVAGCFYGTFLATTRTVAGTYRPRFLLISQLLIGSVLLAPVGLSADLPVLTPHIGLLIVISAMGSAIGNYLLVIANKRAEASLIAPLIYTQLLSATAVGVMVFGDWPDVYALIGLGLIAFSGLASLFTQPKGIGEAR